MEVDVFGGQVGAHPLQEAFQVHARPLADVIPALHADMADDDFLLRQRVELLRGPGPLVVDATSELQLPAPLTGLTSSMS
jgi:hypothetical protein